MMLEQMLQDVKQVYARTPLLKQMNVLDYKKVYSRVVDPEHALKKVAAKIKRFDPVR
jgi:hypothetical protein